MKYNCDFIFHSSKLSKTTNSVMAGKYFCKALCFRGYSFSMIGESPVVISIFINRGTVHLKNDK